MQDPTSAVDSGFTYPVYTAPGGSGGTPVPQSNTIPPSYEACVGRKPCPQSHAVPPSYEAHVGGKPVPRSNPVPPSYGRNAGGNPVPHSNPSPPSYEERISGHDDSVQGAPTTGTGAQAEESDKRALKAEERRKKWAMFAAGNLISAAVVISDIAQLDVCYDEYIDDFDDDEIGSEERQERLIHRSSAIVYGV